MDARVRRVQGLRTSGAAGPHGSRPTRAAELDAALADYEVYQSGTPAAALADYGIGPGDCIECGHPRGESHDPEVCHDCATFAARCPG